MLGRHHATTLYIIIYTRILTKVNVSATGGMSAIVGEMSATGGEMSATVGEMSDHLGFEKIISGSESISWDLTICTM